MRYFLVKLLVVFYTIHISCAFLSAAESSPFWQKVEDIAFHPNSITVGQDGRIWFSTSQGVFVKDGDSWKSLTIENSGLPDNEVYACDFDSNGAVWFGTYFGAVKYDGENWEVYDKSNSGITSRLVRYIATDGIGGVWCAWYKYLSYFDGQNWTDYSFYEKLGDNINWMITDSNNNLWVGTRDLRQFDGTTWHIYNEQNSTVRHYLHDAIIAPDSVLYFVGWGLQSFDGLNWLNYGGHISINSLALDSRGIIWSVSDVKIHCFDGCSWCTIDNHETPIGENDPFSENLNSVIAVDKNDVVWIAALKGVYTFSGTIVSLSPVATDVYKRGETVTINWFSSRPHPIDIQYSCDGGSTWDTIAQGIDNNERSYQWDIPDSLFVYHDYVKKTIILKIAADDVYIPNETTSFSIEIINTSDALIEFSQIDENEISLFGTVTCFAEDTSGGMWAGMDTGIARYDGVAWQVFDPGLIDTLFTGLERQTILDCAVDSEDNIWFGLKAGILRYNDETWDTFLPGRYISQIAADRTGSVWVVAAEDDNAASFSLYTLYRFKGGVPEQVSTPWENRVDGITAMGVSPDDELFIFRDGLLAAYDGTDWRTFSDADGMPPVKPVKFVWDANGDLRTFDTEFYNYLHLFSFRDNTWVHFPDDWNAIDPPQRFAEDMAIDYDDRLWYIVDGQIMMFNENQIDDQFDYTYSNRYGWDYSGITAIYIDRNNIKWLGGCGEIYRFDETALTVEEEKISPEVFTLCQNYPNPFNTSTTIEFTLLSPGYTNLTIYNLVGQKIRVLENTVKPAGRHAVTWNAHGIPTGLYLYTLTVNGMRETRKMMLVK